MDESLASEKWLRRMADAEDAAGSVSVGGLASDLGMICPEGPTKDALAAAIRDVEYYKGVIEKIGDLLGQRARLSDYGVDTGQALPVRIYELIEEQTKQKPAVTVRHLCPKCGCRMNAEGVEVAK